MTEPKRKAGAAAGDWKRPFLAALAETPNVARAAKAAGVATSTVYDEPRLPPPLAVLLVRGLRQPRYGAAWPLARRGDQAGAGREDRVRASIERKVAALKARALAREEAERLQAEAEGAGGDGA